MTQITNNEERVGHICNFVFQKEDVYFSGVAFYAVAEKITITVHYR